MKFLNKRVGLLDAVCVTGGEPTLQNDLKDLLTKIKALGYLVKLDTNGGRPAVLKELVEEGLVDYVAMDIKNSPARYGETAGVPGMTLSHVEESIRYLLSGAVEFEFRTTVAEELHTPQDFEDIGLWLQTLDPHHKAPKFFIQPYVDRDSVLVGGLHTPSKENLILMQEKLTHFAESVSLRGTD